MVHTCPREGYGYHFTNHTDQKHGIKNKDQKQRVLRPERRERNNSMDGAAAKKKVVTYPYRRKYASIKRHYPVFILDKNYLLCG